MQWNIHESERLMEYVRAFERRFSCFCSFHDFTGDLVGLIGSGNCPMEHHNSFCDTLKSADPDYFKLCCQFEISDVNELLKSGRGFIKRCHAGVLEAAFPLLFKSVPYGVMFAGPYRPSPDFLKIDLEQGKKSKLPEQFIKIRDSLPLMDEAVAKDILPLGSLLAERISLSLGSGNIMEKKLSRKERMQWFFKQNFQHNQSIIRLAEEMELSESRVSQLLREYFGKSFPEMMNEYRMEFAEKLLINSIIPMSELAKVAGFAGTSYFYRIFQRKHGMTPLYYREKFGAAKTS